MGAGMGARVGPHACSAAGTPRSLDARDLRLEKIEASPIARLEPVAAAPREEAAAARAEIVFIEDRALIRECLGRSFKSLFQNPVATFTSVDAWLEVEAEHKPGVIILGVRGNLASPQIQGYLRKLAHAAPMVLMTDTEQPDEIVAALGSGARGCIPTGTCLEVAAHAIRLVMAGGTFVPANSLIAASRSNTEAKQVSRSLEGLFTPRQNLIIEELCRGKANKVIAHDLNMCESTVKVHVRNIMKKLKATSRTEVAYFVANGLHSLPQAQRDADLQGRRNSK
jgi:DNA-binding NarL/FixJ family response regulator